MFQGVKRPLAMVASHPHKADAFLALSLFAGGCATHAPPVGPGLPFAAEAGPIIVAHRGGALEVPENTLAAVRHAINIDSDWQEIDVQLSKDLRVVVMHDDTLDRTTNGSGPVGGALLAELQELTAGQPNWSVNTIAQLKELGVSVPVFGDRFAGEKVPSLEQVLHLQKSRLMIDIKADSRADLVVPRVVDAIVRAKAHGRVAVASSERAILESVFACDPSIPLIGIAKVETAIGEHLALPIRVLAVRQSLVETALRRRSPSVAVWAYTAYTPDQARDFVRLGAHGVVTDVPSQVVELLRSHVD